MPLDGGPLVDWRFCRPSQFDQPAEQVGMRARRDQMRLQDRMHLVLDPGPMPNDLVAASQSAPELQCAASGSQTSGRKPAARNEASTPASILSVLT